MNEGMNGYTHIRAQNHKRQERKQDLLSADGEPQFFGVCDNTMLIETCFGGQGKGLLLLKCCCHSSGSLQEGAQIACVPFLGICMDPVSGCGLALSSRIILF